MAHIALYRTWRPQAFRDIVGQKHITQTLQNSLREERLTHAYLFNGPRGTGKTTAAKILAKAVNCERGPAEEPCNECSACRRITEGAVMDVVEIDAASNRGVEEIRDIREKVKYAPTEVRQKVYIIDEVHMLTTEAFNALLKTLEEPPAHVMFILATTEPHRLPATIISRCQRFDFRRVPLDEQVSRLTFICGEERVTAEPEALQYVARLSDGGMRDALSLLDQIIAYTGNHVTLQEVLGITGGIGLEQFGRLAEAVVNRDAGAALSCIELMMQEGKSAEKSMENLLYYFRDALMLKLVPNADEWTDRITDAGAFRTMIGSFSTERLFHIMDVLNHYQAEMKYSAQPQTLFEVAILKLCSSQEAAAPQAQSNEGADKTPNAEIASLNRKIVQLEQKLDQLLKTGVAAAPGKETSARSAMANPRVSSGAVSLKTGIKLDPYLPHASSPELKQALGKWGQVLQQVKDRRITVHAWLIDGEPVAATEDALLLVFKSAMHRETTEKPAHKELVEQVMQELLGKPYKLVTAMMKDWKEAQAGSAEQPEVMRMEAPDSAQPGDDIVEEAIKLFGEDLVVVKE
ncbi:DNA polymerase III subunit gamma/tau [Paenibacillus hemerocallicola]|uniref:DNA-directed DNA polymerase n=1 Tax=Paenibacillus hemerocallicola TaxID=1172614 RepID=A0A5C4SXX5_9BACL|nr:DNA polymerase III subunit gamma/tau [Paenibacillus hemerocallicola]TNJ60843.1 DNA polymerase III subunit gamma/tau [Paenibacillus hemerocallicola]